MTVIYILIVACIFLKELGADIYMKTDDQPQSLTSYGYVSRNATSFTFSVKTCKIALIFLLYNKSKFEINIASNYIYVYSYQYRTTEYNKEKSQNILNCSAYYEFNVSWRDGEIKVMKNKSKEKWYTFLEYTLPHESTDPGSGDFSVYDIRVSTIGKGEWLITTKDDIIATKTDQCVWYTETSFKSFNIISENKSFVFETSTCDFTTLHFYTFHSVYYYNHVELRINNNKTSTLTATVHTNADVNQRMAAVKLPRTYIDDCDKYQLYSISWKNDLNFYLFQNNEMKRLMRIHFPELVDQFHPEDFFVCGQAMLKIHYHGKHEIHEFEESSYNITTTSAPDQFTNQSDGNCVKVCFCVNNISQNSSELEQTIINLKTELTVTKATTSNYIRSKTSAADDRPSAAGIGYIGAILLATIVLGIVVLDIPNLLRSIEIVKRNLQR